MQHVRYDYHRDSWLQKVKGAKDRALGWQEVIDLIVTAAPSTYARAPTVAMSVLRQWARAEKDAFVSEMRETMEQWIPTEREAKAAWDTWIDAVCDDGHEMSRAVMQHFVWQVKRKLARLPVTDHMCPIWTGATGSGKSTEILKFLEPVKPITSSQTLDQLVDERHLIELSRHFIIYLDEMVSTKRANRDALKTLITSDYITAHVFFTQRREYIYQAATLIGSSNRPVVNIIHDTTSARRFWEVRCRRMLAWEALRRVDHRVLWGSVSEANISPLDGNPRLKRAIQELQHQHLRVRPPIECWAEERGIEAGDVGVETGVLYDDFCAWCGRNRVSLCSHIQFGREMKGLLRIRRYRTNNFRKWLINKQIV